jgi:signal transduction histidine kinase
VAHHVSAIAIQAQAAQVVGHANPDAVHAALGVIESEASRALSEMRAMVGTLREGTPPALTPQKGTADLEQLTTSGATAPQVTVSKMGDVTGLPPSVDAAVFRIAQESVTNALRHSRGATTIDVSLVGDEDVVRLRVANDGEPLVPGESEAGFGLVGMAERVALLGGTFEAGPRQDGGWLVSAILPRAEGTR